MSKKVRANFRTDQVQVLQQGWASDISPTNSRPGHAKTRPIVSRLEPGSRFTGEGAVVESSSTMWPRKPNVKTELGLR